MVDTSLTDDAWTRLLQEIATVLPNDVWLTAATGQKAARKWAAGDSVGNVTGQGFDQELGGAPVGRCGWATRSRSPACGSRRRTGRARAWGRRSRSRRPPTSRRRRSRGTIGATGISAVAREPAHPPDRKAAQAALGVFALVRPAVEPTGVEGLEGQGPAGRRRRASSRSCSPHLSLRSLQQEEPQKRAQLEALRVAIPDEPNLAQFILDANTAANVSGIQFLSIHPSPPSAETGPWQARPHPRRRRRLAEPAPRPSTCSCWSRAATSRSSTSRTGSTASSSS